MTNAAAETGGLRGNALVIGLIMAGAAVFLWLSSVDREVRLRQSAAGYDALAIWLRDNGQPAQTVSGWERIDSRNIWLRILPLYDVALDDDREPPVDDETLLRQQSEIDMGLGALREKIELLPTLLVLPKWRSGLRLTGVAHPDLLNDAASLETLLGGLMETPGEFVAPPGPFARYPADVFTDHRLEATLYLPRTLKGSDCDPLIGSDDAMLLGACRLRVPEDENKSNSDVAFWLLTDPDLLDAHGLRLGDNADIATAMVGDLAGGNLTVIDYTTRPWADRPTGGGERSWSDLLRFFGYPFVVLWAGLAATAALFLWRGAVRYGAPTRVATPRAARSVSVEATARLLRLSGHDDSLVSAFMRQRLEYAAARIFGPRHRPDADPLAQLVGWLKPRDAALARALSRSAEPRAGGDALHRLDEFETTLAKVLHDFGRTPRHG